MVLGFDEEDDGSAEVGFGTVVLPVPSTVLRSAVEVFSGTVAVGSAVVSGDPLVTLGSPVVSSMEMKSIRH